MFSNVWIFRYLKFSWAIQLTTKMPSDSYILAGAHTHTSNKQCDWAREESLAVSGNWIEGRGVDKRTKG